MPYPRHILRISPLSTSTPVHNSSLSTSPSSGLSTWDSSTPSTSVLSVKHTSNGSSSSPQWPLKGDDAIWNHNHPQYHQVRFEADLREYGGLPHDWDPSMADGVSTSSSSTRQLSRQSQQPPVQRTVQLEIHRTLRPRAMREATPPRWAIEVCHRRYSGPWRAVQAI